MTSYCDYHPNEAAKWHCAGCQRQYCAGCMPDADRKNHRGFCPQCNHSLKYQGAAGQVEPFWTRIGAFFRYPLSADPLILIALCTLVPAVLSANLIGLVVSVVLLFVLFKYTYSVIQHTAEGNLKPPALATAFTGSGFGIILKQFAVFFLMGGLISASGMLVGSWLAVVTAVFLALALPASVIVLAMEDEVLPAINPIHLAALMARIGWPYFVLYAHLILMFLAGGAVQDFALDNLAPWLGQLIAGFVNSYFTLIFFHMLGYLLFQYQGRLGFASDLQDAETEASDVMRDRSKRLDVDMDMALKDGHYDRLQTLLTDALKRQPLHPGYAEKLYLLIRARQDSASLLQQHRRLLPWLRAKGDSQGLAASLKDLQQADPGFALGDPQLAYECAQLLYQEGEFRLVLQLLQDFHKRFPEYENLAGAYLLVAKTLANGLQRFDKAGAFLRFIQQKCSAHPLHRNVEHYLSQARAGQALTDPAA